MDSVLDEGVRQASVKNPPRGIKLKVRKVSYNYMVLFLADY